MAFYRKRAAMSKKYLLYARVSPKGSTWDAMETSVGVQFSDMRSYILRDDPTAEFVEIYDEFKSGKNLKRPGVQMILADLEKRPVPWDCLVVWNLDRLSRSLCDALPIFTKLRDAEREFISINQSYLSYTGAMARYMLHQTIAIAELERGMTSERVSAKMRWIAAGGKIPWGKIPLGYRRDEKQKNTVILDLEKADIVKDLFQLYAAGKLSFADIQSKYPGMFRDRSHIYKILRNKFYAGIVHYAGEDYAGEHPAIIDRELYDRVQIMLEEGRQNHVRRGSQKYDYLLSGMIRCHCGRMMTAYSVRKKDRKYFYYKCTSPSCKNAINAESMDLRVLKELAAVYTDKEEVKRAVELFIAEENKKKVAAAAKLQKIEKEIQDAKEKEMRIADMFLRGEVSKENSAFWNSELAAARAVREDLESKRKETINFQAINNEKLFPVLMEAAAIWAKKISAGDASFEEKRNLIMSAVKTLECISREKDMIHFKLDLVMSKSGKWCAHGDSNPGPND